MDAFNCIDEGHRRGSQKTLPLAVLNKLITGSSPLSAKFAFTFCAWPETVDVLLAQLDLSEDVVKEGKPVEATFTYSVQWRETDTPYEKRMDKYRRYQFLPQHLEASPQRPRPCCLTPCVLYTRLNLCCPAFWGPCNISGTGYFCEAL